MTKNKMKGFSAFEENAEKTEEKNLSAKREEEQEEKAAEKKPFWKKNGERGEAAEDGQYAAERMEFLAEKTLFNEGLPSTFAQMLSGGTEEETLENIAMFKEQFEKAVEKAVSEKMKGFTPKTNSGMTAYDPFLAGLNG